MISVLAGIWVLHVVAMMSPGANVLLVSQLAASGSRRSAMFAALGVGTGAFFWASSAVLGVNVLFHAFPQIRLGLQLAGGVYLLYIATRLWCSPMAPPTTTGQAPRQSDLSAFRQGLLTNITNPKSALFFSSIFATSLPAHPSAALQLAVVTMIVSNALVWHLGLAHFFSGERVRLAYASARGTTSRVAAIVFGSFGLGLLTATVREALDANRP